MELYKEILIGVLASEKAEIVFPNMQMDILAILENKCYKALLEIKNIIQNDDLTDAQCFEKIEEVIVLLEDLGSDGGVRHDF